MNPVGQALWFIETKLDRELTLDRISAHCDMTRFGLSRLFSMNTGWPVMRYVRSRRLTRAAHALAQGAPDILQVALDAGYGSHEAFTRAFRDLFGMTPEDVRARRTLDGLSLMEPLRMKELKIIDVVPSRFETAGKRLIAGMSDRYTFETNEGIPALWQAFIPYIGTLPGQVDDVTYGVCCNPDADGSFEYIAGVEVTSRDRLPAPFRWVELEPQRYAVFEHVGHISTLHQTFYSIWNGWLPKSGFKAVDAPEFERYSADYDPVTGAGVLEIWLPVEPAV
ncbi:AraC family transcriptional regulator [Burkholderia contaminans FFH2055]|uniref:AraC family transcriptional regulator n=1 Tax=Burkholderia contaminans TaxID=488447 RepID=A0A3N8QNG5_9BURK|nr:MULTISPECIES: AraC family transcriptional regulator [Burkholderia]AOL05792.1 AraC family transcriptional regulator [Burkholderia contaminans]ELK6462948.1 AraC family transcriptional regulator [Burkholderia contaminans]KKL31060.1 AraC family transcriptional regulator [Burkholderia contaminans FFH2055]MEB4631539.1 AraC family transcriptional regulator [Burkholderia contaminans]MEB4637124.1 AraC family transcriptional regulator [Burkholderia contaminans]